MEIFITKQCEALTGSLGKGYGYFIQRRRSYDGYVRFFSQRSKWNVPPDGHLRFIFACADLARMKTHIIEILVPRCEFQSALREAGHESLCALLSHPCDNLSATDIINFRRDYLPNLA